MRDQFFVVHPDSITGFVSIAPKGRWKDAYRAWRIMGRPEMSPQEMFAKWAWHPPDALPLEFGRIDNFRFVICP